MNDNYSEIHPLSHKGTGNNRWSLILSYVSLICAASFLASWWTTKTASSPAVLGIDESVSRVENLSNKGPHIVLIVLDDVGYNDVGWSKSTDLGNCTPYMDSLARNGIILTNLYAQPTCTPSRAALMTGRYPIRLGLQHWQIEPAEPFGLSSQETILPQFLRTQMGYKSYLIGKWHLGHYTKSLLPTSRGFDYFFGFYGGGENYFSRISEDSCDSTYHNVQTCYWDIFENERRFDEEHLVETHNTVLHQQRAETIIGRHDPSISMFLDLSYPNVHVPIAVPPEMFRDHAEQINGIRNNLRRTYAALTIMLDEAVGNLTGALNRSKLLDETLMIVVSDNGGNVAGGGNNYPLRGGKQFMFEGGVRVHGFVYSPSELVIPSPARGRSYAGLMHFVDWLPTVIEGVIGLDNVSYPYELDGINLWPQILGETTTGPGRSEVLLNIDYLDDNLDLLGYTRAGLRMGEFKILINEQEVYWYNVPTDANTVSVPTATNFQYSALFNLTADPEERVDLSLVYPDQMKVMYNRLTQHYVPLMGRAENLNVDPAAFEQWDQTMYLGPWLESASQRSYCVSDIRGRYEQATWGATTGMRKCESIHQD